MMSEPETMIYVATQDGHPGYCAACVDMPQHKKDTAKSIARWIREDLTVTRVTTEQARAGLAAYCEHRQREKSNTPDLFA